MKTKSIIILASTLLIGFFLGWLSSTYLQNKKFREIRAYSSMEGIRFSVLNKINPTEEQKKEILPVVEKFSRKNLELRRKYMKEFIEVRDEFHNELFPLLTKEQVQDIEKSRHQGPALRRNGSGPNYYRNRPADSLRPRRGRR